VGIQHDFRQFADRFQSKPEEFSQNVIRPLAIFVDAKFAQVATNTYMQDANLGGSKFSPDEQKPNRPRNLSGPLRKVSSRLERAVASTFKDVTGRGGSSESEVYINPKLEGVVWSKIITVPYAATHEYGSSYQVRTSADMVSYFWAKAYETSSGSAISEYNQFRRLALAAESNTFFDITIPARPYARPALKDITSDVVSKGEELIAEFMQE